jgi:hypothetical protein
MSRSVMVTFFFFSAGAWLGVLGLLGVLGVVAEGLGAAGGGGRISIDVVAAGAWVGVLGVWLGALGALGVLGACGEVWGTGVAAALCQWISY